MLLFIAPFLIVSVAVAAGAKATGMDRQIAIVFGGDRTTVIVAAALFGALSPFCSCGVVPIIAGLLGAGVPLAPVMAFWISSPLMDPEMFVLMAPVLGLEFTMAKTLAAIAIGLAAGFATEALVRRSAFADPLKVGVGRGGAKPTDCKSLERSPCSTHYGGCWTRFQLMSGMRWPHWVTRPTCPYRCHLPKRLLGCPAGH